MMGKKLIYRLFVQRSSHLKYMNRLTKAYKKRVEWEVKQYGDESLEYFKKNLLPDIIERKFPQPWEINDIIGYIYVYYDGGNRFVADWYLGTDRKFYSHRRKNKISKQSKSLLFKQTVIDRPEIPLLRKFDDNAFLREQFIKLLKEIKKSVKIDGLFCDIRHAILIAKNLDFVRLIKRERNTSYRMIV